MTRHKILFMLITFLLPAMWLQAQEDDSENSDLYNQEIDSAMAISPLYLPTSFTSCNTTFFKPIVYQDIDTTMQIIGQYDPLVQTANICQSLGTNGQAHKPMNFNFKKESGFSLITNPYPLYYKEQSDLKFYKLKTSYTQLAFCYGITTENTFTATHAQNFRDMFHLVFNLRGYGNSGYFTHQKTSNVVADILAHFETPSEIYGCRLSYIINYFNMQENGGLLNVQDFYDHTIKKLQGYNMNLYDATSRVLNHDLMFQQYLNIWSKKKNSDKGEKRHWGTFMHTFQFKMQSYSFYDDPTDSAYYTFAWAQPTDTTKDTLSFFSIANTIQFSTFPPYKSPKDSNYYYHITGGITHEYVRYQAVFYEGNSFTPFGQIDFHLKRFDVQAKIYYTLGRKPQSSKRGRTASGCYQQNDMNFNASMNLRLGEHNVRAGSHDIGADFDFYRISPDYIYSYFVDNHYYWDNTWPKQNIIRLTPYYQFHKVGNGNQYLARAEFSYFMLHNYVYWNAELQPTLLDSYANIIQLHLTSQIFHKGFGLNLNGYLQYANREAIQIPVFAAKMDVFYRFNIFKNKAKLQIGLNAAYNTNYYADGYAPLLHQFYHQHEVKTGNYCYLDLYLAIQVQRIQIYAKGTHLLSGLMGYHYFTTPNYPMQNRRAEIGITWRFHD